ncbi:hypothetical protein [Halorubrum sp. CGM4_25_10-8A]|jgi:hypothetical protein|uniref:hypothetical protein n=1 Tax=Halorubrum sp. CGM4_25_10-8A TaxID=2518116 RepID=UPI0010F97F20|nr:hypothetical protein [Halorubrum sp. CGM4_25_10-8A]TKX39999.1 hypothetical protein EXE52_08615 [Halorubrum sp. CGM4_25_10-8A]
MADSDKPKEGDKTLVQLEFGPPKYNAAVPLKARRAIGAIDENLEYEKGERVEKVVVQGELEVTNVYMKEL